MIESVPPTLYGGTERVVSYLAEALVREGHDVTLFASGDSVTSAQLEPVVPRSLRLDPQCRDPIASQVLELECVFSQSDRFDVVHFHNDYLHFPLSRLSGIRQVTTLHGRLDLPELLPVYHRFPEMPLVSISDAQRAPIASANWLSTIHHGLPLDLYSCNEAHNGYLAFLGRISPEKRLDRGIHIARCCGLPLRVAAKIDRADTEYFHEEIEPLLSDPGVEFLGEVDERGKQALLGNALALLLPIDWPEPFGLVIIEAMACGTPTIAYSRGSIPEIIEDGVTGYVVHDEGEAVEAVGRARYFDRRRCRAVFEARFSAERMARDYIAVYRAICARDEQRLRTVSER